MKRHLFVLLGLVVVMPLAAEGSSAPSSTQTSDHVTAGLSIQLMPLAGLYSGSSWDSQNHYSTYDGAEGGLWVSAAYRFAFFPPLFVGADIGAATYNGFVLGARLGLGQSWKVFGALDFSASIQAGGWLLPGSGTASFVPSVGLGLAYPLVPWFSIGLGVSALLSTVGFAEWTAGVSLTFTPFAGSQKTASAATHVPAGDQSPAQPATKPLAVPSNAGEQTPEAAGTSALSMAGDPQVQGLFPVFYKYYDDHPLGSIRLKNTATARISGIRLTFIVRQYMDGPKECTGPTSLAAGEAGDYQLFAIFADRILDLNEPTKAQAQMDVTYEMGGKSLSQSFMQTVRIFDRNAMTWEDDRRAAAFINAKDPTVMSFSRRTAAALKAILNPALNANLQAAAGLHAALNIYGITYAKDPKSASIASGKAKVQPDSLLFPRQTLEYRGGDCDDLTILYCALCESVGIDTALITTPGHIFMAFAPDMSPAEARAAFSHPDDLLMIGDRAWIPVEVTDRSDFFSAWQSGAREWRENRARGQANFYETHDAWSIFEPAGPSASGQALAFPDEGRLSSTARDSVTRWIESEIAVNVSSLQAQITASRESSKSINALGVLYARYGLFDKALAQFSKVLQKEQYVPSLLNVGNLSYIKGDAVSARGYWQKAYAREPQNAHVLLALARVNHDLENYFDAKKYLDELKNADPALADQFSYLALKGEEASRAAEAGGAGSVLYWEQ